MTRRTEWTLVASLLFLAAVITALLVIRHRQIAISLADFHARERAREEGSAYWSGPYPHRIDMSDGLCLSVDLVGDHYKLVPCKNAEVTK